MFQKIFCFSEPKSKTRKRVGHTPSSSASSHEIKILPQVSQNFPVPPRPRPPPLILPIIPFQVLQQELPSQSPTAVPVIPPRSPFRTPSSMGTMKEAHINADTSVTLHDVPIPSISHPYHLVSTCKSEDRKS
jgi:hypothetical protein